MFIVYILLFVMPEIHMWSVNEQYIKVVTVFTGML